MRDRIKDIDEGVEVLSEDGKVDISATWYNRRRMAWYSFIAMMLAMAGCFFISPEHAEKISPIVINFMYACVGVISFYMGTTAFLTGWVARR